MLTAEHLLVLFALVGAGTFTYLVYTKGLVPAVQKITTWWNTAKTDVATLEARVAVLESKLRLNFPNTGPVIATAPAQAAPSPAAPTGASPAAAAPSPTKAA